MRASPPRTQAVSPPILAVVLLVGLALAGNWYALTAYIEPGPASQQAADPASPQTLAAENREPAVPDAALGQDMIARPLFYAGRRPVEIRDGDAQAQGDTASPPPSAPDQIQLAGIARQPGGRDRALIRFGELTRGAWIEVGQVVQGWRLDAVTPQGAVLEGDGGRRELSLFRTRTP